MGVGGGIQFKQAINLKQKVSHSLNVPRSTHFESLIFHTLPQWNSKDINYLERKSLDVWGIAYFALCSQTVQFDPKMLKLMLC